VRLVPLRREAPDSEPRQRPPLGRRLLTVSVVVLALMILGLVFTPAHFWRHPVNDGVYQGFDPNLLYSSLSGNGSTNGQIAISSSSLQLTALPASEPTVHLITSPLSFNASTDVRVIQADSQGASLSVGIWSPSGGSGYFLVFGSAPTYSVSQQFVHAGSGSITLVGGVVKSQTLGTYIPGQRYHVSISLDKEAKTITTAVSQVGAIPFPGQVVSMGSLTGAGQIINSPSVPVVAGKAYMVGGWSDYIAGTQASSIGISWADKKGNPIATTVPNWWINPTGSTAWIKRSLAAVAPVGAATASVFVGAGPSSAYLFGDVFLEDSMAPNVNMLPNGGFAQSAQGWNADPPPNVIAPTALNLRSTVGDAQFPQIFNAFRPTLSVWLSTGNTVAASELTNYVVTLPSQPSAAAELVEKIDDARATALTLLLSSLAGLLCVIAFGMWAMPYIRRFRKKSTAPKAAKVITVRPWAVGIVSALVVAYLALNSFLFHFGSPHFDIFTPKIWSYISATYNFTDLYHWPSVLPAAGVQGGVPKHEAVFPYGPTKVYYYAFIGQLYRHLLSAPGPLVMNTFQLEFLLKFANVLFALLDSLLIFLIVRSVGATWSGARLATALFSFNPALIFIMSVWGSTETVSLAFMLGSIWLAEKNRPAWAWIALGLGAFTRPQMLVLGFFIGCAYLRKFPIGANVRSIAWSVVVFFFVFTPLLVAISPSLPVDYVVHIVGFQVGNGQADPGYSAISPGYYSVWTLPLQFVNGQHGIARMWYPKTALLFGSTSYAQASAVLVTAFVLIVGLLILLRRSRGSIRDHLPLVAFGMLGWLMFSDALISRYFLYGLVALILCRKSFRTPFYLVSIVWLTLVTLLTAWSHFAQDLFGNLAVLNPLNPTNSALTRTIEAIFRDDRVITTATVANLAVLVCVGIFAYTAQRIHASTPSEPQRQLATSPVLVAVPQRGGE
jgi:Gpi18-like mannosyltransferase